jgi:hypothetical protein
MILEIADIRIRPGEQAPSTPRCGGIDTLIAKAKGFRGLKVNRGVEPDKSHRG